MRLRREMGLREVETSGRVQGAAHTTLLKKRATRKARQLRAVELRILEHGTKAAGSPCDRYGCAFFCFCVHTRSRMREACIAPTEPYMDVSSDLGHWSGIHRIGNDTT